jgi:hypothetical protein
VRGDGAVRDQDGRRRHSRRPELLFFFLRTSGVAGETDTEGVGYGLPIGKS